MKRALLTGLFFAIPTCLTWAKRELKKRGLSLIPLRSALGSSPRRPLPFDRGEGSSFIQPHILASDPLPKLSVKEVFKAEYLHAWGSLKVDMFAFACGCCTKIFNYQHQVKPGYLICKWCYFEIKGGKFYQGKDMSKGLC